VEPIDVLPSTLVRVEEGDPVEYLESKRMQWVHELEVIKDTTDDLKQRADIIKALLNYSSMGRKQSTFKQSNIRQEVHLHGENKLPDFNHLPTKKLRTLLGEVEEAMREGPADLPGKGE
jgi:hypothetical protein